MFNYGARVTAGNLMKYMKLAPDLLKNTMATYRLTVEMPSSLYRILDFSAMKHVTKFIYPNEAYSSWELLPGVMRYSLVANHNEELPPEVQQIMVGAIKNLVDVVAKQNGIEGVLVEHEFTPTGATEDYDDFS
jgi:hypothetical protein